MVFSLVAGDEDSLQWHDVCGGREQRVVRPVLQTARCGGSLSGGGLEALQVRQRQPRQDGVPIRGVTEADAEPGAAEESAPVMTVMTRLLAAQGGFIQVRRMKRLINNPYICV